MHGYDGVWLGNQVKIMPWQSINYPINKETKYVMREKPLRVKIIEYNE